MDDDDDGGGGEAGGAPAWMATFADMATLLLTFFVLLLSFANMDVQDFKMALGSVKDALGVEAKTPGYFEGLTTRAFDLPEEGTESEGKKGGLGEQDALIKLKSLIEQKELQDHIEVTIDDENIVMTIYDQFQEGSARLEPKNFEDLDLAVELCADVGTPVLVEAHTDNVPLRGSTIGSNWELSALRAGVVARYLLVAGKIPASRLTVAGYADQRPEGPNKNARMRARNRRIRIVLARRTASEVYKTNPGLWRKAE